MSMVTGLAVESLQQRVDALERLIARQADLMSEATQRIGALEAERAHDRAELARLRPQRIDVRIERPAQAPASARRRRAQ